jgi:hypothetical protein
MAAEEVETLRAKLSEAELELQEAQHSRTHTRDRLVRIESQLAAAQGAAFASERAAEQLRQAQERMRDALAPLEEDDENGTGGPDAA